jgi:hypothetical protein
LAVDPPILGLAEANITARLALAVPPIGTIGRATGLTQAPITDQQKMGDGKVGSGADAMMVGIAVIAMGLSRVAVARLETVEGLE